MIERRRELLVHERGIVARDEVRIPSTSREERGELFVGDAGEDRRIRDLVPVEVQDREDGAVTDRVEKLVRVPARRERARLGLTVTHDARDDEVGIVERAPKAWLIEYPSSPPSWIDPGVSGATWLGTPPGNENCRNSASIPVASRVTDGYVSVYEPSSHVFARIAGPP